MGLHYPRTVVFDADLKPGEVSEILPSAQGFHLVYRPLPDPDEDEEEEE